LADSAFFVDAARPITQMRLRWDSTLGVRRPDQAEYFLARERLKDSPDPILRGTGKGPSFVARKIDEEELSLYNEAALGRFGFFVEIPYREVDLYSSTSAPDQAGTGFGDMTIGTKSLLLDCELLQISFQFKTYLPVGSTGRGVGDGHVSLEPALLFGLKLAPETYLQAEAAYWIPIGGDNLYEGNIFHAHISLNHILWCILPDVQLIGTLELSEYSIINGHFTDPASMLPAAATSSMVSGGPGLRLNICDKIDFGVGTQFNFSGNRWADDQFRAEFRWRF
jgi:hypothetical protein